MEFATELEGGQAPHCPRLSVYTRHAGMVTGLQFTQNWMVGKVLAQSVML